MVVVVRVVTVAVVVVVRVVVVVVVRAVRLPLRNAAHPNQSRLAAGARLPIEFLRAHVCEGWGRGQRGHGQGEIWPHRHNDIHLRHTESYTRTQTDRATQRHQGRMHTNTHIHARNVHKRKHRQAHADINANAGRGT